MLKPRAKSKPATPKPAAPKPAAPKPATQKPSKPKATTAKSPQVAKPTSAKAGKATGTGVASAKETGEVVVPVAPDAAELRKPIPAALKPADVPKGAVPSACPMPVKDASGVDTSTPAATAEVAPVAATPEVDPIATTAPVEDQVVQKRVSSFQTHSDSANRYKARLRTALANQDANTRAINGDITRIRQMDRDLDDHRRARIHLTYAERKL